MSSTVSPLLSHLSEAGWKIAAAIPEQTGKEFPSRKTAVSTMVSWRSVAAERNSLWIWSSTRNLCEEPGSVLGIFCSVVVCKAVSKELIQRETSPWFNRGNWKPCCGRVISAKQLPQQNRLCLWEKGADKGLLIYSSNNRGFRLEANRVLPMAHSRPAESFSCFLTPHSSASSLPGLICHVLHRFASPATGLLSAGKLIYSLQCSCKPAMPPSFCIAFYLPINSWPYCISVSSPSLLTDSLAGSGHCSLSLAFLQQ